MNFLQHSVLGLAVGQTLGLRPEHLSPSDTGQLSGTVTHVERLGGDTNLLIRTEADERLTRRLFGQDTTEVGTQLRLAFDPAQAFYFDAEGDRIL